MTLKSKQEEEEEEEEWGGKQRAIAPIIIQMNLQNYKMQIEKYKPSLDSQ